MALASLWTFPSAMHRAELGWQLNPLGNPGKLFTRSAESGFTWFRGVLGSAKRDRIPTSAWETIPGLCWWNIPGTLAPRRNAIYFVLFWKIKTSLYGPGRARCRMPDAPCFPLQFFLFTVPRVAVRYCETNKQPNPTFTLILL